MLLKRLDYPWRLAATGFSFAFLFAGGALMALTAFPFVALVSGLEPVRRRRVQYLIHLMFRFYIRMLVVLRLIDLEILNAENLNPEKLNGGAGRLIIANHPTLLDVVLLMALNPRAQCIVKKELWENRYLGSVVRAAGYIRNDLEPEALLAACGAAMAEGNSLIVFPEGTRSQPGQSIRFRRGFANIATLLQSDILLVTITCDPSTLTKGENWWTIPPVRPRFRVAVGECLDMAGMLDSEYRSVAARKLVRFIEGYYVEQLENA
jgi:1-acyl-sn-glycerol-3-phosphate acyltransferase